MKITLNDNDDITVTTWKSSTPTAAAAVTVITYEKYRWTAEVSSSLSSPKVILYIFKWLLNTVVVAVVVVVVDKHVAVKKY